MFKGEPVGEYAAAAQNLRVQEGLREQFREGLLRSRYYRPTMERIFRAAGIPPELVTLAHVESGFHGGSRSSAGAVGIWQFTRDTGKHYMKITRYHDDRLNPDRETVAAIADFNDGEFEALQGFVTAIEDAGCAGAIVHARKAVLGGLSPKENRAIPPLRYDIVRDLKRMFPRLPIVVNGGFRDTRAPGATG